MIDMIRWLGILFLTSLFFLPMVSADQVTWYVRPSETNPFGYDFNETNYEENYNLTNPWRLRCIPLQMPYQDETKYEIHNISVSFRYAIDGDSELTWWVDARWLPSSGGVAWQDYWTDSNTNFSNNESLFEMFFPSIQENLFNGTNPKGGYMYGFHFDLYITPNNSSSNLTWYFGKNSAFTITITYSEVNPPLRTNPVILAGEDVTEYVNTPVYFITAANESKFVVKREWNFGDGGPDDYYVVQDSDGPQISYNYKLAGTYNTTYRVTYTNDYVATDYRIVTIRDENGNDSPNIGISSIILIIILVTFLNHRRLSSVSGGP